MAEKRATALEAAEANDRPKKAKLSKNLLPYFVGGFIVVLIGVAVISGGSDLGQGAEDKKRQENLEKLKAKDYDATVPDPAAAAEAAAERTAAEAKKIAAKPDPGAPLPSGLGLPTSQSDLSKEEIERYETARRAISEGRRSSGSAKGRGAAPEVADDGVQSSVVSVESAPRASFLSTTTQLARAGVTGDAKLPVGAQMPPLAQDAAGGRPSDPRAAGRESAMQLMEMQAKMAREMQAAQGAGKPTTSALPVDGNSAWLYAAQSREATENKPLQAQVTLGRYVIFAGTAIQAVLTQALDTKLPGQITARVSRDVYDSRYGRFLVVPRGSTLTGSYRSAITDGQSRVLMAFDRLITPAGGSVPLGNMSASDVLGVGGVPGELHTHFFQRLGIASLLALETAVLEKGVGQVGTVQGVGGVGQNGQATSSASGQIMLQTANQELQRQYAVTPNITLEPAAVITIISTADIEIAPLANTR